MKFTCLFNLASLLFLLLYPTLTPCTQCQKHYVWYAYWMQQRSRPCCHVRLAKIIRLDKVSLWWVVRVNGKPWLVVKKAGDCDGGWSIRPVVWLQQWDEIVLQRNGREPAVVKQGGHCCHCTPREEILGHSNQGRYLLTYSMVQSPSWVANWFAASQEIPRISRNQKVHYRTHKRSPPLSIRGQPNPVHIPTFHLLEIHSNIIHPSSRTIRGAK